MIASPVDDGDMQIEPILRLAKALEQETEALRRLARTDLTQGNQIKSQALLELTRHARVLRTVLPSPGLRTAIETLRDRLADNQAAIALHLEAARTVTAIMVATVERESCDRTYGRTGTRSPWA